MPVLGALVPVLGALVPDRGGGPGQDIEGVKQRVPVPLDRQDEVAALLTEKFGGGAGVEIIAIDRVRVRAGRAG